jgi:hypothetical protein
MQHTSTCVQDYIEHLTDINQKVSQFIDDVTYLIENVTRVVPWNYFKGYCLKSIKQIPYIQFAHKPFKFRNILRKQNPD